MNKKKKNALLEEHIVHFCCIFAVAFGKEVMDNPENPESPGCCFTGMKKAGTEVSAFRNAIQGII